MSEQEKTPKQTDELREPLESVNEVNEAISQQGDDAAAGIPRDTDAAKHDPQKNEENEELQGAP